MSTHTTDQDVLQFRQVPKPVPGAGEVLISVRATTVGRTDCGALRAHPFFVRLFTGLRRPKHTILGVDFAGEVEGAWYADTNLRAFHLKPGHKILI